MSKTGARMEPPERSSISSAVAEEITEFMRQTFVGTRSRFARPSGDARFAVRTSQLPEIAGDRIRSTLDYTQTTDPFDYLLFFVVDGGNVLITTPAEGQVELAPGAAVACPVGVPVGFAMRDITLSVLRLPLERLDQMAADAFDAPPGSLRFEALRPVSPAMHRYWRAVVNLTNGALMDDPSPMASPLVAEEMTRNVAIAALHTFPNTTMTAPYTRGPGWVAPAALRRAVAYIEANADQPVTLSAIATAAGIGARALQYAFRAHYGTTPMGYVRRVRLEHAHRELRAADPTQGTTVKAVAARWGFAKPDRFTAAYREAFGVLPSQTLRT
ncbi:helix-turn-helix transcriptional regulator [Actinomadura fibrosa]|uniref:Helix-turn-helix transcriptional regulator n=1 Tax=Actinomadura fibrosa TaxID=111802 RepID=A0ABW2XS13_9ACTN|nr:helix-turn-helix transcriptional regulator [Actinomadura fibrosa]